MGCDAPVRTLLLSLLLPRWARLGYNRCHADLRLRHPCVGMAHLADAFPASQAKREACQASGPARPLGHTAGLRRLHAFMAEPSLGTAAPAAATPPLRWVFSPPPSSPLR